jgi:hypothetical protein
MTSALAPTTDIQRLLRHVRFVRILLKKSFGGGGRNFLGPLMRFVRDDVRGLVVFLKNDHGLSYRRYGASQTVEMSKISSCEIFGVVRFSTFSTVSVKTGSRALAAGCLLHPRKRTLDGHSRRSVLCPHIRGTLVPVEEPSTASQADIGT